jgi:hypothetical protein
LLAEALQSALDELVGYIFSIEAIVNAKVSAFHPSKNIVLPDVTSCRAVIAALAKLDITMLYDLHRTDYRDGCLLHLHANTIDIAFYDKLADLRTARTSTKRAFDKEPVVQSDIVDKLIVENELNVLRYEIRLNNRRKIKEVYPELQDWSLKELFDEELCQRPLLAHWQRITESIDIMGMDAENHTRPCTICYLVKMGRRLGKIWQLLAG